jgi:hypothetical protein
MNTFDIVLKEGTRFQLQFDKFECTAKEFLLYDEAHEPSKEAFLLFNAVAAIVPADQPRSDKIEPFRVHLTNDEHVDIYAPVFDMSQPPSLKFHVRRTLSGELFEVKNVYVAISEVIAIAPAEGLRYERKRALEDW